MLCQFLSSGFSVGKGVSGFRPTNRSILDVQFRAHGGARTAKRAQSVGTNLFPEKLKGLCRFSFIKKRILIIGFGFEAYFSRVGLVDGWKKLHVKMANGSVLSMLFTSFQRRAASLQYPKADLLPSAHCGKLLP